MDPIGQSLRIWLGRLERSIYGDRHCQKVCDPIYDPDLRIQQMRFYPEDAGSYMG